ncbi:MAG: hypothetical protein GFH25_541324n15 [Chloroflexi bacterium AL-N10]|nr:hypothetical protein [Chloroflexi bacterium AL-N10]
MSTWTVDMKQKAAQKASTQNTAKNEPSCSCHLSGPEITSVIVVARRWPTGITMLRFIANRNNMPVTHRLRNNHGHVRALALACLLSLGVTIYHQDRRD